jgi:hypothetical protein
MAEILHNLPSGTRSSRPRTAEELRELAAWYRDYAERAGNSAIWESRLRTADELEALASQLEGSSTSAAR